MKNFKFVNIALIVIIVILLLFGLYICVFQVSSSNNTTTGSNLKTASETVKYDISETNNAIIHTRYLGNNNLFYNIINTYIIKTVTTYNFDENNNITSANIKYYYKNENDAKKDYKNKESDLLKTSFNSNLEISKNVITQNITDLFKDMSKSEVKNNILSGYQE